MKCPECGAPSRVLETRARVRRRKCTGREAHRFTTHEVLAAPATASPLPGLILQALEGCGKATRRDLEEAIPQYSRTAIYSALQALHVQRLVHTAGYSPERAANGRRSRLYAPKEKGR